MPKKWVVELTGSSESNSSFDEGRSLTRTMLQHDPGFTALLAFDDLTAFGAVRALRDFGRRVPEECSVVGFDDVPYAALFNPSLSTVRQPMERMGSIAVERILSEIQQGGNIEQRKGRVDLLPPELVQRESTAAFNQQGKVFSKNAG
jgi:LacI family transcriptional regulator